jgi:hypothetical protein
MPEAASEEPRTIASGLESPIKMSRTEGGNLLLSEHQEAQDERRIAVDQRNVAALGQPVPNSGRVSLFDKEGKRGIAVIDGLPISIMSTVARGNTLYLEIGAWDAVLPGPIPGTEIPNPNPSSPILSSVLVLELPAEPDALESGFKMESADQDALARHEEVTLTNEQGQQATVRMLADFPNYTAEPMPNLPEGVRGSNPFGMVEADGTLYLVDAAQNTVLQVDADTGETKLILKLPEMTNPSGMPPTMDAVPDSIRFHEGRLLVPLLSGFPFPDGAAEVRSIGLDGSNEPFIGGLNSAIDVLPVNMGDDRQVFFVLEYSLDQNANAPGRLLRFDTPTSAPVTAAENLISPTNLEYDEQDGTLYINEIFVGNIRALKVGATPG